jgi:hypothetical protein
VIAADDLSLLGAGFGAAMAAQPGAGAADVALHALGWAEVLSAAPRQGAAEAFSRLGATGAAAGLLDDVVLHALGHAPDVATCVVLPDAHRSTPPGRRGAGGWRVAGLASGRCAPGRRVLVPVVDGETTTLVEIEPASLTGGGVGLDPGQPYRHVTALVDDGEVVDAGIDWDAAVVAARGALAHELIAAARVMLEQARVHALQRVQFGRAIAGFQAVRHRLADALVSIEAATSVAADYVAEGDPLLAAVAKSLAGRAARTTAVHAQQVLAGIGFTTDHPFHLTMKRSLVLDTLFGSSRTLPAEIGAALLAAGHAPRLVEL